MLTILINWIRTFLGIDTQLAVAQKCISDLTRRIEILEGRSTELPTTSTELIAQLYHERNRKRAEGLMLLAHRACPNEWEFRYEGGHVEARHWLVSGSEVVARYSLEEFAQIIENWREATPE